MGPGPWKISDVEALAPPGLAQGCVPKADGRWPKAHSYMWLMTASPNAEHDSSVAPSIMRARS